MHPHSGDLLSHKELNMSSAKKCMELEIITLSKTGQAQKEKTHILSLKVQPLASHNSHLSYSHNMNIEGRLSGKRRETSGDEGTDDKE